MNTNETKLILFHNAVDNFFKPYYVTNFGNLQTILNEGAKLLSRSKQEDYDYLLNAFSEIANKRIGIGKDFFKNCLRETFIRKWVNNE